MPSWIVKSPCPFFLLFLLLPFIYHVILTNFIIASCRIQMAELESRCEALEESQRHSLTEQLNRMSAENLQLRDRTDELSAEIELLRGQLAAARFIIFSESPFLFYIVHRLLRVSNDCVYLFSLATLRSECVGLGPAWRSEPTMSGAVKRRNGEEEVIEDHVGKVRKREAMAMGLYSSEVSPRPLSDNQVCVSPSRLTFRASCRQRTKGEILLSNVLISSRSFFSLSLSI